MNHVSGQMSAIHTCRNTVHSARQTIRCERRATLSAKIRELHPYCLGFGLFWSVPLSALLGAAGIAAPSSHWLIFVWVQQFSAVAFLPLLVCAFDHKAIALDTGVTFLAGLALALSGFLYVWCFALGNSSLLLSVTTAILLGGTCAFFYLAWQIIYSNEGQAYSAIYLSLSSVIAVALCLAVCACPPIIPCCLLSVVLPFGSAYALWRSSQDTVALPARKLAPYKRAVFADVWKPVLCGSVICLVWSLASHMPALYDGNLVFAMLAGLGTAGLFMAVFSLRQSFQGFGAQGVYQTLFPLVGIVLFAPAMLGEQWLPFTVGTLTFGARLILLLSFMLAAAYAARTQFSPAIIYLICTWPLHLASLIGDTIGSLLVSLPLTDYANMLRIPALCLVVGFAGFIATSFGKRAHSLAEPVDDTLLINPEQLDASFEEPVSENSDSPTMHCSDILTSRESEVVDLLLKGNTIAAIANKLLISENTVRGHMKRIYHKLNVHSRQELVDLLGK